MVKNRQVAGLKSKVTLIWSKAYYLISYKNHHMVTFSFLGVKYGWALGCTQR